MHNFLKQSTSVVVLVGPFLDLTDMVTPETGITLGAADEAEVRKHGAAAFTDISSNTFTHISNGYYALTLTTTDTNTVGNLEVVVMDTSVCLPIRMDFTVLPANTYDSLIGGTDVLQADVTQIDGVAGDADLLGESVSGNVKVTIDTGSTAAVFQTSNLTEATDDHYIGLIFKFLDGALKGQAGAVTDYDGTTFALTFAAGTFTEAPSSGDKGILV